jgi:cobalt-zinc-cadmium efflux system outer membrane protein
MRVRPPFTLATSLLAILLAGCAHFEPQPLSPENSAARLEGRSLTNAALQPFLEKHLHRHFDSWPPASWDLDMLTLAAFCYHPDLDVARAQWLVAQGGEVTAGQRPNPSIAVYPQYNSTTLMPSPWVVSATLDVPIETAGKRGYRKAQAAQLSEAARLNIASVAWQVRGRVRSSLTDLYSALETERLLKEQQALQTEVIELTEGQFEAGAVSAFEVTQARLAGQSTLLALRDAVKRHAETRALLAEAAGVPVRALDEVELSFEHLGEPPKDASLGDARRQALLNRADILGALAEYAASQSALQLEIAKQYPDVHLNPGYEFDQGDSKWGIGLTVELPVFNQNQGPIAEAKARRQESAARFNALQAKVLAEVDRAVAAYQASSQSREDAEALVAGLRKQEQSARAMYEAGETAKGDLAGVRLQLSAAAQARLDALVKWQQALGALEDALQVPLDLSREVWEAAPEISDASRAITKTSAATTKHP